MFISTKLVVSFFMAIFLLWFSSSGTKTRHWFGPILNYYAKEYVWACSSTSLYQPVWLVRYAICYKHSVQLVLWCLICYCAFLLSGTLVTSIHLKKAQDIYLICGFWFFFFFSINMFVIICFVVVGACVSLHAYLHISQGEGKPIQDGKQTKDWTKLIFDKSMKRNAAHFISLSSLHLSRMSQRPPLRA